ncbi:hypothetical protein [Longimicrobium sp.]|uniref:hypothetical protein n=1 Tax=Longimicrobium sp. TaxID=2029185 RepID=UPI003B3B8B71
MLVHMIALAQGGPRLDGDAVSVAMGVLVIGAVALVFWASRPSVMARYSAASRPEAETPAPPADPDNPA